MGVVHRIKQLVDDKLIDYVFNLLDSRFVNIADEDLFPLLKLYSGPEGLLRYLHRHLSGGQKEDIAAAFANQIKQLTSSQLTAPPRTESILRLTTPYLRYSSQSTPASNLKPFLKNLASDLRKTHGESDLIALIYMALLELDHLFLDKNDWLELYNERKNDVAPLVFSGLSAIDLSATFDWLDTQTFTAEFADLLAVHLPHMYTRAPELTAERLGELLHNSSRWQDDAREVITTFCSNQHIHVRPARIAIGMRAPRTASTLLEIVQSVASEHEDTFSATHIGNTLAIHEISLKNGLDDTKRAFHEYVENTAAHTSNFISAAKVLRARSNYWRRSIVKDRLFPQARKLILTTFLEKRDTNELTATFVRKAKSLRPRLDRIYLEHSEYHEDRVLMTLFQALMDECIGPEVVLENSFWSARSRMSGRTPRVRLSPRVTSRKMIGTDKSIIYTFHGYHLFARKTWLYDRFSKINGPQSKSTSSELNSADLKTWLAKMPIKTKLRMAVDAGVLHYGVAHFNLDQYFSHVSGESIGTQDELEPRSADLFARFLKGDIDLFCAGAIHSDLLKEWFKGYDYGIEVFMKHREILQIINDNRSGGSLECFVKLDCESEAMRWWDEFVRLFRLIATYINNLGDIDQKSESSLRPEEKELRDAWRQFTFAILGAQDDIADNDDRRWAFAAYPKAAPRLFSKYNEFVR
jgi:hypothetical protein